MCGVESPLGGKAKQEVKRDSAFQKYFCLSGICGRSVGNCQDYKGTLTSTCKATFLFVIVFLSSYNHSATCGTSKNRFLEHKMCRINWLCFHQEVSWGNANAPSRVSGRFRNTTT